MDFEFYHIGIRDYKHIINVLKENYDWDVSYYSKIIFRHRMAVLMNYYKIKHIDDLLYKLQKKQIKESQLWEFLHIPITEMFRDPAFWRAFIKLIADVSKLRKIRILFPGGFAGNNELFSLLILLEELHLKNNVEIMVTTPHPLEHNLLSAILSKQKFELSKANFNRLELKQVNFDDYFEEDYIGNRKFKYFENYINTIQHVIHDFREKPMAKKQDMIFFRNQLLYFTSPEDENILDKLTQSIRPGGFLFIGVQERIMNPKKYNLELVNSSEQIYKKW